jgi:uncharacterized protein (UPF0332 family)
LKAREFISKAETAVASAQLLLATGDIDGACNRAYYAMFDAARAALMVSSAPVEPEIARTHSGLISAFSLHLVKTGKVPLALGRALNRQHEIRLIADYSGDMVDAAIAKIAVDQAADFVKAIKNLFSSDL